MVRTLLAGQNKHCPGLVQQSRTEVFNSPRAPRRRGFIGIGVPRCTDELAILSLPDSEVECCPTPQNRATFLIRESMPCSHKSPIQGKGLSAG